MTTKTILKFDGAALRYHGRAITGDFEEPEPSPFDLYFDFGDQYTLTTKTAAAIPLAGNPLAGATRRYIAFYMDTTLRYGATRGTIGMGIQFSQSGGEVQNTFGIGPGAYIFVPPWSTIAYAGVYLSGTYNPNPPTRLPEGTANAIDTYAPPVKRILIKIICDTGASNEIAVQYKLDEDAWQVSSVVGSGVTVPFDVHNINVIESSARDQGSADPASFSATDFKGAGFSTLEDALAWLTE